MKTDNIITLTGKVTDVIPGTKFRVEFQNKHSIIGYLSGKLKVNLINIYVGDIVKVEINPMDLSTGKIVYRFNSRPKTTDTENNSNKKKPIKYNRRNDF